jgi:peptidyl-prolyl cis-trans isomerase D
MVKETKEPFTTKKHMARLERERRQTRYILIGSLVILVLVFLSIGYGLLDQYYLQKNKPVATVNGVKISTQDFQSIARYNRYRLVDSAVQYYQMSAYLGSDPSSMAYIAQQLFQIQGQLEPQILGEQTLQQLIEAELIKQEAKRRGINITSDDIEKAIQEAFGYYSEATQTPTSTHQPLPTSTLSATQLALVTQTPTSTATEPPEPTATMVITATQTSGDQIEATPTLGATATATPFSFDSFQSNYQETLNVLEENASFTEDNLKYLVEMQVYRDKVREDVLNELGISPEQEQVWARHILVEDEETALQVRKRIKDDGEDWSVVAAEVSMDTGNKDRGGDLGWFGRGRMVPEFEQSAFNLEIGEISEPVQTEFGWHLIQVLGHEVRTVSDSEYQETLELEFLSWLDELKNTSEITTNQNYIKLVPLEPTLPTEITDFIAQVVTTNQ